MVLTNLCHQKLICFKSNNSNNVPVMKEHAFIILFA